MRRHGGLVCGALTVMLPIGLTAGHAEATDRSVGSAATLSRAVDDPARQAAIDRFYDIWLHNQNVGLGWTGNAATCEPGQVTSAAHQATAAQINYFRGLARLRPVTLNSDLTPVAQRTALMMHANNQLSHDPPSWWKCHTTKAAELAGRSNIAFASDANGADAVTRYVEDSGHTGVAHRRWILHPRTAQMAAGSTPRANAVVVVGMPQHRLSVPNWISWPPAGYFPAPLEPGGRWSLSAGNSKPDFSAARITVTDSAGAAYEVKKHPVVAGFGAPTLVWQVLGLRQPALERDAIYHVRVTGVQRSGERVAPITWTVRLVKPDRPTTLLTAPVIRGTFAPGQMLSVSPGVWSPASATMAYQWTRDGAPIEGAIGSAYLLKPEDVGGVVSVIVRAEAAHHLPGHAFAQGQLVAG